MTTRKSIFKLVNLRGVDNNIVEPPTDPDDDDDGPIIEIINNSTTLPHINHDQAHTLAQELEAQSIKNIVKLAGDVEALIKKHKINHTSELAEKSLKFDGQSVPLAELADHKTFQAEYLNLYNRWLLAKLRPDSVTDIEELESQIQSAHLVNVTRSWRSPDRDKRAQSVKGRNYISAPPQTNYGIFFRATIRSSSIRAIG